LRSTATAGLTIQSLLSRAWGYIKYAMMSNLDLSVAFGVVNVKLLLKRQKLVGLSLDFLGLIQIWLHHRKHFVNNGWKMLNVQ
jgi:hypothetical protein